MLVTVIKQATSDEMEVDWDADGGNEDGDILVIEKLSEALRTCYSCQLSDSLNFKPSTMSLAQMREATAMGKQLAAKSFVIANNSTAEGKTRTLIF